MDRKFIGRNFHNMVLDMAEDYHLIKNDGEEYIGKISIIAKTASTYMIGEREYLMTGVATFPDIAAQTSFRGCYFHREINPDRTYILVSTIPKDTTENVAEVYAIGCNTKVSLAILKEEIDENGDRILTPETYAEDIPVYWDSTLQKQRRSSDGNLDQALYYMQIPAKFGVAQDHVVLRDMYQLNEETNKVETISVRFRVESIDPAMVTVDENSDNSAEPIDPATLSVDENGYICGIFDVQMSIDTRN